jgi:hypothetical protein
MCRTPFRTSGVDFRLHFRLGERHERERRQSIGRVEQVRYAAALHLFPQEGFKYLGGQQPLSFSFPC